MALTTAEKKLIAHLLELAGEEFSNHGCNDLDLVKNLGLSPQESLELRRTIAAMGDDEPVNPDWHLTHDSLAMEAMARRIREEL